MPGTSITIARMLHGAPRVDVVAELAGAVPQRIDVIEDTQPTRV